MYKIEKRNFGFRLTFAGQVLVNEMEKWRQESERALVGQRAPFGVFVDMRKLTPLFPDAQQRMIAGQKLFKDAGMVRSAVIVEDQITMMQFVRLAKQSGIYAWERYISAAKTPNWEAAGLIWLANGADPDE